MSLHTTVIILCTTVPADVETEVVGAYSCTKIQENSIIFFLFGHNVLSIFLFSDHIEIIMKV